MASGPLRISLGRYDPWRRTPSIEIHDGRIKFVPGKGTYGEFESTECAFPPGSHLEYRVEMGDRFFDGDHGQALGRTLWAVEPTGNRKLLARGFVLYVSLPLALRNLTKCGIPLKAVRFHKGVDAKEIESEIPISNSPLRLPTELLLGLSPLWLGAIDGMFISRLSFIVGVGLLGFAALAIAGARSNNPTRARFLKVLSSLPTYAAGYAFAVVIVRFAFKK